MNQNTFTLSNSGKEFPARFGGIELTYNYPTTWPELIALLPEGIDGSAFAEAAEKNPEAAAVIYGKIMGQGIHLDMQKDAKDALGKEEGEKDKRKYVHADADLATVPTIAQGAFDGYKMPKPGSRRGEGQGTKLARTEARANKAEAEATAAKAGLAVAYKQIPKNARKDFGARLVAEGVFSEDELKALDEQ